MRIIVWALDTVGAALFLAGACGLAYLAHPFLSACVGGACCLAGAYLLDRPKAGDK